MLTIGYLCGIILPHTFPLFFRALPPLADCICSAALIETIASLAALAKACKIVKTIRKWYEFFLSLTCWQKGITLFVLIDNYDSFTWNLWHFLSDLGAEVDILRNDAMSADAVIARDLDGNEKRLEADTLLPFFGMLQQLGPIAEWQLDLQDNHIAVDPATMATDRKGLFAAGDIVTYPGKLTLILTGFAEAAAAAHAAHAVARPDEILHFEYSTTKGVPGSGGD